MPQLKLFARINAVGQTTWAHLTHLAERIGVCPPALREEEARDRFGFMRGRVKAPAGFDFTAPVIDEPSSVAEGRIHD